MAAGASAALLPTLLAMAGNALLIPRALAIPNMMFLTAVRYVCDTTDVPVSENLLEATLVFV
jgi:hypothetical protein